MYAGIINIILAFIEGFALIISPCILPILPIILSSSLTGGRARPFGIIIGFILAFTCVTIFSRALINLFGIDQEILRYISYALLLVLGLVMVSSFLTEKFTLATQRLTQVGNTTTVTENGFWGGLLFGCLIGIIWTPCAGPILAAVIVQVIIQSTTLLSALTILAFAIGAGIPMLAIAILGRTVINQFAFFRTHAGVLRKILGIIIILTVLVLWYFGNTVFSFANNATTTPVSLEEPAQGLVNGLSIPYKAPAIDGINVWINSPPLTLTQLRGKVVLIDFWTYSCINCIRTLPYLKEWYAKYHDQGLEIIGIHSPEFAFEQQIDNVKRAVAQFGIRYPVALDNQFVTWRNYNNQYWPAHYLINKEGEVVYRHFGEGEYAITENNIRFLLGIKGASTSLKPNESFAGDMTPETYLGYQRANNFLGYPVLAQNQSATYQYPTVLPVNYWGLRGTWLVYADKILSDSLGAALKIHFKAGKVYAVMGAPRNPITVKILLDGKPLGKDLIVDHQQLYTLFSSTQLTEGELELIPTSPGLEVYTFTFGD